MKKKQAIHPKERLARLEPATDCSRPFFSFFGNLDLEKPHQSAEHWVFFSEDGLRIYEKDALLWRWSTSELRAVRLLKGIGCFSLMAVFSNGEEQLFARGTTERQNAAADFVKAVNRALEKPDMIANGAMEKREDHPPRIGKKRALLRLLKMTGSEWKYVAFAMVCFFATTGIGLLLPYLNRVLVDDYIRAEGVDPYLMGFLGTVLYILLFHLLQRGWLRFRKLFLELSLRYSFGLQMRYIAYLYL